jgi:hypothetical protein
VPTTLDGHRVSIALGVPNELVNHRFLSLIETLKPTISNTTLHFPDEWFVQLASVNKLVTEPSVKISWTARASRGAMDCTLS